MRGERSGALLDRIVVRIFLPIILLLIGTITCISEITYIDLNSGRLKRAHVIFGRTLYDEVKNTEFSLILNGENVTSNPRWAIVGTNGIFNSIWPHCRYHNAAGYLYDFVLACELLKVPKPKQIELARHILDLLRRGRVSEIGRYVEQISEDFSQDKLNGAGRKGGNAEGDLTSPRDQLVWCIFRASVPGQGFTPKERCREISLNMRSDPWRPASHKSGCRS